MGTIMSILKGAIYLGLFLLFIFWVSSSGGNKSGSSSGTGGTYGRYDEYEYPASQDYEEPLITSDNWNCTGDCSGHDAGYKWAAENGIGSPDDCGGNSDSFIEGCEAYANEQMIEAEEAEYEEYEEESYNYYR